MLTSEDFKELARVIKATADAELAKCEGTRAGSIVMSRVIAARTLWKLADAFMEKARDTARSS